MKVAKRNPVRIIIVEPENLYRDLLQLALASLSRIEIVGVFADSRAALGQAVAIAPDVAVLGHDLDKGNSIQLALKLRSVLPEVGVVLLSDSRTLTLLSSIPDNRLLGWTYLIDRSTHNLKTLGRAIQVTAAQLLDLDGTSPPPGDVGGDVRKKLTNRQLEILSLLSKGISNAAIAQLLHISEKTIENQLNTIYTRLDIDRDRGAAHPRIKAMLQYLDMHNTPAMLTASPARTRGDR